MSDDVRAAIIVLADAVEFLGTVDERIHGRAALNCLADRLAAVEAERDAYQKSWDDAVREGEEEIERLTAQLAAVTQERDVVEQRADRPTPQGGQPITREDAERISKDGP